MVITEDELEAYLAHRVEYRAVKHRLEELLELVWKDQKPLFGVAQVKITAKLASAWHLWGKFGSSGSWTEITLDRLPEELASKERLGILDQWSYQTLAIRDDGCDWMLWVIDSDQVEKIESVLEQGSSDEC